MNKSKKELIAALSVIMIPQLLMSLMIIPLFISELNLNRREMKSFTDEISRFILHGSGKAILSVMGIWLLIPLLAGCLILRSRKKRKKMLENALQLPAVITNIEQTGTLINHLPQVKLYLKFRVDRWEETAIVKYLVLPGEALVPGSIVAIAYDPKKKKAIVLGGDEINMQDIQKAYTNDLMQQGVTTPHTVHIASTGQRAKAVVVASVPTGKISGGNSEMHITLRVTKPDGNVYDATVDKMLSPKALGLVVVGSIIRVYYNAENPQDLVLQLASQ